LYVKKKCPQDIRVWWLQDVGQLYEAKKWKFIAKFVIFKSASYMTDLGRSFSSTPL
jgi:hypothetical protein